MRLGLAGLAVTAAVIAGVWAWLGQAVPMPNSPLRAGEKLYCLSYSPFRGSQTPLEAGTMISAAQIEEDLTQLSKITDCVRTYSVDFGLDQIAGIAARHGLKVLQGLWLSSHADRNRYQIETAVKLANEYPDTIRAVVVGNEVLLRGEMSAAELAATIREVKARVKVPVTYADVWEFWLRNRDIAFAADFVTIHILPYWEDFPVPADQAAAHVDSIRRKVAQAFPGKEVMIGEVGWPSAGRMREGALPSPVNEARVIQDVLAVAKRENFRVNVIEAFDAPWKRALEGTVGGHWGLLDDGSRRAKFAWGEPVSNHPYWQAQAAGGVLMAVAVFGAAYAGRRKRAVPGLTWLAVGAAALGAGIPVGWAIENVPIESLGVGGWLRSLALCTVAILSPVVFGAAIMRGTPMPPLARILGPKSERSRDRLAQAMGIVLIATLLLAVQVALGLVFDPRYKDFPFAPLTAAIAPMLVHAFAVLRPDGRHGTAELLSAATLALSVLYIAPNESLTNWQSLWLCATLAALALTLVRVRDARS